MLLLDTIVLCNIVTDVFRVRSGDAGQDGRVSEAGRETDKELASTSKLRPRCTRCPYLES